MTKRRLARTRLALLAGALAVPCAAPAVQPADRPENLPGYEHEDARLHQEANDGEAWREGNVELPPFPADGDLVQLESQLIDDRFAYFLDRSSLTLGSDRVTRYVVVLESPSGARNVFFEGLRCETRETRTYAYGLPARETFQPMGGAWSRMARHGAKAYQGFLADGLFCVVETNRARPADEIRDQLASREYRGSVGGALSSRRQ